MYPAIVAIELAITHNHFLIHRFHAHRECIECSYDRSQGGFYGIQPFELIFNNVYICFYERELIFNMFKACIDLFKSLIYLFKFEIDGRKTVLHFLELF